MPDPLFLVALVIYLKPLFWPAVLEALPLALLGLLVVHLSAPPIR